MPLFFPFFGPKISGAADVGQLLSGQPPTKIDTKRHSETTTTTDKTRFEKMITWIEKKKVENQHQLQIIKFFSPFIFIYESYKRNALKFFKEERKNTKQQQTRHSSGMAC